MTFTIADIAFTPWQESVKRGRDRRFYPIPLLHLSRHFSTTLWRVVNRPVNTILQPCGPRAVPSPDAGLRP